MSAFAVRIALVLAKRHALSWVVGGFVACASIATDSLVATARAARDPTHAQPIDWQTSPLDLDLRGMNGERYVFDCPPGKPAPSRVVGSGPYTDDSSICTAAVHAGALRAKAGGVVTIEIRPGQTAYPGSEQNYITSASYDRAWSGGFVVIKDDLRAPHAPSH
ncbi:MAG: LCCL domain-containing protein [Dokdonella sp.]